MPQHYRAIERRLRRRWSGGSHWATSRRCSLQSIRLSPVIVLVFYPATSHAHNHRDTLLEGLGKYPGQPAEHHDHVDRPPNETMLLIFILLLLPA